MRRTALLAAVALVGTSSVITPLSSTARVEPARAVVPNSEISGTVTLITGDKVTLTAGSPPQVEPVAGRDPVPYRVSKKHGNLTVLPVDAAHAVAAGTLDPRLFDVTALLQAGYDDSRQPTLPLIIQRDPKARAAAVRPLTGLKAGRQLAPIGGYSGRVAKKDTPGFWRSLFPAGRTLATGTAKVWLNGVRRPLLDKSVPQIGAPAAWNRGLTGRGVTVAVIDSGIDATHPDLAGQVTAARTFVDEPAGDRFGHGTHVASTIAGTGATYRGVAPDAKLIDAKVCTEGGCPEDAILAAMDWAVTEQRAAVVNMSLGGPDGPGIDPLEQAVNELSETEGTLFVISAGNSGNSPKSVGSPGSAETALTVGAVDHEDQLAEFSSRGPRVGDGGVKPDLTAPGVDIAAARAEGTQLGEPVGDQHVRLSGTSMAAPHAAGAAALLRQQHPDWTGAEIKSVLMASAKPAPYTGFEGGAGRLAVDVAMDQRVTASPVAAGFGVVAFPHDDDVVLNRTITYRNAGDQPIDLQLELQLPGQSVHPFTLSRSRLSVPAKGTADVVVSADTRPDSIPEALFSGRIVATGPGVQVSTPVGIEKEGERYDLALTHLGRDGGDPAEYLTFVDRLGTDCDDEHTCFTMFGGSTAAPAPVRLAPGEYTVGTFIRSGDQSWTMLLAATVQVTADTAHTLDSRTAGRVDISVPKATARLVDGYQVVGRSLRRSYQAATLVNPSTEGETNYVGDDGGPAAPPDEIVSMAKAVYAEPGPAGDFQNSPYSYTIQAYEVGKVMHGFRAQPKAGDFADVRMAYASDAPSGGPPRRVSMGSFADPLKPLPFELLIGPGGRSVVSTTVPFRRSEFVLPGGVQWRHGASQWVPASQEGYAFQYTVEPARYRAGQVVRMDWNKGVLSPRLAPNVISPYNDSLSQGAARRGDTIAVSLALRSDSCSSHHSHPKAPVGSYRLYRDGALIDEREAAYLTVPVPAEEAEYRLESRVTDESMAVSSRIDTSWTFRSGHSDGVTALPLMVLRFTPRLDDRNRARAGHFVIPVSVQRQPGAAAATPRKPTVEYSSDQGKTWRAATVVKSGSGWTTLVVNPAGTKISLRGRTSDSAGNSVEQLIQDAYLVE